ncbi:hypothetical protein GH153_02915 [bacterium]|nr:hypothetical protein [bacterium]
MRKRSFLKGVCIFTCLSILMLSVPGAIASERTDKRTFRPSLMERAAMFFSFLPFLNLNTKGDTSSETVSNDGKKIQITGGKLKAMLGDDD